MLPMPSDFEITSQLAYAAYASLLSRHLCDLVLACAALSQLHALIPARDAFAGCPHLREGGMQIAPKHVGGARSVAVQFAPHPPCSVESAHRFLGLGVFNVAPVPHERGDRTGQVLQLSDGLE